MNAVNIDRNSFAPAKILWRQVWGLAALLAAITFSWIAYGFYQPRILIRIGFSDLAVWLGIFQGLLGAIVEPIVGWFSDRVLSKFGSRLPLIVVGVTLAGLIFVGISWLVETQISDGLRWVVPLLMTVWVIAMIIFRGPAIALLMSFAPTNQLPQANAILALVLAITSATSPILGLIFKHIGASMTFILGAIALLSGGVLLWRSMPRYLATGTTSEAVSLLNKTSLTGYALPFLVGLGSGLEINLLLHLLPHRLFHAFDNLAVEYWQSGILLIAGIATLPLRSLFRRQQVTLGMGLGLLAIVICLILSFADNHIIYLALVATLGAMALGLVLTNTIPLALAMVSPNQAGFGTGLYFGGSGMGTTIFASLLVTQGEISPINGTISSLVALAIASICLYVFANQK
ncbi:SLC45 family MFS transporter [Pseudanabaena sp. UWO310]|uniref:SLC45 family MFS transporter n=1 Tax=Pseudanabaena sp. UWO310 TaxID=2480795 RepID=UPI001160595F|nr:SLC45 family MFS transporter [Pseudanabaena sp. UWO310]TYQ24967.1 SLC45 family MFS transporter [Pseudanabaena sp. UWO310]